MGVGDTGSMSGDPRLKPAAYFDRESDYERAEFLERYAEARGERLRDDEVLKRAEQLEKEND